MGSMTYRVGIWCAVSSKPQAAPEKESLPEQEQLGREFAEAVGAEVVQVYRVPGHSRDLGFYTDAERQMDAYRQLREDVETNALDVLWALDIDRLGREPALQQQVIWLVERQGSGEVYLQGSPHVLGQKSTGHRYIELMQGGRTAEAQEERVRRYLMGMRGRTKRGLHPNRWPYGYRAIRNEAGDVIGAEFDEEQKAAVEFMTRLFLDGHSYHAIRLVLKDSHHRAPRRGRWHYSTVRRILLDDIYAGIVSWGKQQAEERSEKFPAIWDEKTHAAMIRERRRRRRVYHHRQGGPLTGVAFCSRCGATMGRMKHSRGTRYLRCNRHAMKRRNDQRCHPNYIQEAEAIQAVAEFLQELATPEALESALSHWQGQPDLQVELETCERRIGDLNEQRKRLALALAAGDMDIGIYREADKELEDRLLVTQTKIRELKAETEALADLEVRRAALKDLASGFPEVLGTEDPAAIATSLQNANIHVMIESGQVLAVTVGKV